MEIVFLGGLIASRRTRSAYTFYWAETTAHADTWNIDNDEWSLRAMSSDTLKPIELRYDDTVLVDAIARPHDVVDRHGVLVAGDVLDERDEEAALDMLREYFEVGYGDDEADCGTQLVELDGNVRRLTYLRSSSGDWLAMLEGGESSPELIELMLFTESADEERSRLASGMTWTSEVAQHPYRMNAQIVAGMKKISMGQVDTLIQHDTTLETEFYRTAIPQTVFGMSKDQIDELMHCVHFPDELDEIDSLGRLRERVIDTTEEQLAEAQHQELRLLMCQQPGSLRVGRNIHFGTTEAGDTTLAGRLLLSSTPGYEAVVDFEYVCDANNRPVSIGQCDVVTLKDSRYTSLDPEFRLIGIRGLAETQDEQSKQYRDKLLLAALGDLWGKSDRQIVETISRELENANTMGWSEILPTQRQAEVEKALDAWVVARSQGGMIYSSRKDLEKWMSPEKLPEYKSIFDTIAQLGLTLDERRWYLGRQWHKIVERGIQVSAANSFVDYAESVFDI